MSADSIMPDNYSGCMPINSMPYRCSYANWAYWVCFNIWQITFGGFFAN